jgi:hypothetical protein
MLVVFTRKYAGERDNVGLLHNSVQHFRLDRIQNRNNIYVLLWKDQLYQQWYRANISATQYGVTADFPLYGPIHPNLP